MTIQPSSLTARRSWLEQLVYQPVQPERGSARERLEEAVGEEFAGVLLALLCGRPFSSNRVH